METREGSQGRSQEVKSKGREWEEWGGERGKKEHVLEVAQYNLDFPIVKLQRKETKVELRNA